MTQKKRLVKMIVYGCQMNFAEAERLEGAHGGAGGGPRAGGRGRPAQARFKT